MSVMMTYLFQGWNCRGPEKYRDMLLDIATGEIGHVEMLSVMIARLLEEAPLTLQDGDPRRRCGTRRDQLRGYHHGRDEPEQNETAPAAIHAATADAMQVLAENVPSVMRIPCATVPSS